MDPFCDVRSAGPISYVFTFEHAADPAAARERCCPNGSHRRSSWYHITSRGLASTERPCHQPDSESEPRPGPGPPWPPVARRSRCCASSALPAAPHAARDPGPGQCRPVASDGVFLGKPARQRPLGSAPGRQPRKGGHCGAKARAPRAARRAGAGRQHWQPASASLSASDSRDGAQGPGALRPPPTAPKPKPEPEAGPSVGKCAFPARGNLGAPGPTHPFQLSFPPQVHRIDFRRSTISGNFSTAP
jgi:hypothetical protein